MDKISLKSGRRLRNQGNSLLVETLRGLLWQSKMHTYTTKKYFKTFYKKLQEIARNLGSLFTRNLSRVRSPTTSLDIYLRKLTRSSITSPKSKSNSGIFPQICLFCSKTRKKVGGIEQKLINVETSDFRKICQMVKWWNYVNQTCLNRSINERGQVSWDLQK